MGLMIETEHLRNSIKFVYKLDASLEFLSCADNKITEWFYARTGLRPSKKICITITISYKFKEDGTPETDDEVIRGKYYARNEISGMAFSLYINKVSNTVVLVWWSKSGRIYEITDTDIDYDDIEFALEPFEPQLYFTQLDYKEPNPFKTDDFTFNLDIEDLNLPDVTLELTVITGNESFIPEFIENTYKFIENYNRKSESRDRKYGVIHNSLITQKDNALIIQLDSGSAGIRFLQLLFKLISDTGYFSKVVMS